MTTAQSARLQGARSAHGAVEAVIEGADLGLLEVMEAFYQWLDTVPSYHQDQACTAFVTQLYKELKNELRT